MALITKAEVKLRLGISDTTQDDLIDALIIDIRDWLPDYLHNPFTNPNLTYTASTISFSSITISDSAEQLIIEGFVTGMDIYVSGSLHNDNFYEIANVVGAGSMTISSDTFTVEAAGTASPTIYQVLYPSGLKTAVSNMIRWQLNEQVNQNIAGEKIGNYSVSYKDTLALGEGAAAYPSSILGQLAPYRKLGWV